MLVHVQREERLHVPHGEGVLRVADVIEEQTGLRIVAGPDPAARGDARGLQILFVSVEGTEALGDEVGDFACGHATRATEILEEQLVVEDAAEREGEVHLA